MRRYRARRDAVAHRELRTRRYADSGRERIRIVGERKPSKPDPELGQYLSKVAFEVADDASHHVDREACDAKLFERGELHVLNPGLNGATHSSSQPVISTFSCSRSFSKITRSDRVRPFSSLYFLALSAGSP